MQIDVKFLDNLKLEARFDDFVITTDQPIRYKGDGTAPSPFDYFLASSALCAAYFVKVYCKARGISTHDISLTQNNIIDPENRYNQTFHIKAMLPATLSEKDREGILRAIDRCTVKKVVQEAPLFRIEALDVLKKDSADASVYFEDSDKRTMILGRDVPLEETIKNMTGLLAKIGINIEIASWRNLVPHVWSVHIRDADSPMCFTNGKGASKESALCSALGEYIERVSCNYFYNDTFLGEEFEKEDFLYYPDEKWFAIPEDDTLPEGLMDEYMIKAYSLDGELCASHLYDTAYQDTKRGIVALPFQRQSDKKTVYIPANLIGNLFVSNGMSAGNTMQEAKVQCLSEIFERAVKNKIIKEELALADVPESVLERYPKILAGIRELRKKGYPILVKDASLGGRYPVMCVTLLNKQNGGVFASFGAHPKFEVALERSLTELLQGRSFEGLNDVIPPSFRQTAVTEPNNLIEHFIDSVGVISWRFFSRKPAYPFCDWNFSGTTKEECDYLMGILKSLEREVYIAEYDDFGQKACRILVPNYSEIYPIEDLVWDNTNKSLAFRKDILNLHSLTDEALLSLAERLEKADLDPYTRISELIGIEFEEHAPWGQLDIGELSCLIYLALGMHEEAKEHIERFMDFNDNLKERQLFYQALDAVLEVALSDDLLLEDFIDNMTLMYGKERMENVIGSFEGRVRFYGLSETDMGLKGIDKHQKLMESYRKLHRVRKKDLG